MCPLTKDGTTLIEPLRKLSPSGSPYVRPSAVQAKLAELSDMSRTELLRRARVSRSDDPDHIPSECLFHFLRTCRSDNSERAFADLYRVLLERVLRRLPRPENRDGETASLSAEAIRDDVLGRFTQMLASDRLCYSEALDYFEIRFDQALKRLRLTAQEKAWREQNRTATIEMDEETGEPSPEVERAAANFQRLEASLMDDPDFRLRFDAAIDALPPMQRRIVTMLRQGIPIDSKEEGRVTIARALSKSEKTIRTHRDAAFAALWAMLSEGGDR